MSSKLPFRSAAGLAACLFLGACGGDGGRTETPGLPEGATLLFPRFVILPGDTAAVDLHLDAENEPVVFESGVTARAVVGEEGRWGVDYSWLYLHRPPARIYTFDQMDSLASLGEIDDDTLVGVAVYRRVFQAPTLAELEPMALEAKPERYPPRLLDLLVSGIDTVLAKPKVDTLSVETALPDTADAP